MSQSTAQHSARTREDILAELAGQASALRRLGVTSLGVFGSYARNEQTATSDVDLLVTFDYLTFRAYMGAKLLLEAALGSPVDLVLADDLRPRLRERVLNEVIYVARLSATRASSEAALSGVRSGVMVCCGHSNEGGAR